MSLGWWTEVALNNWTAWYLTYLLYSTVIFGSTLAITRLGHVGATAENRMWRIAVLLAPAAAFLRIATEHTGTSMAAGPELMAIRGTAGWVLVTACSAAVVVGAALTGRMGRIAWLERHRLSGRRRAPAGRWTLELERMALELDRPVPRLTESDRIRAPLALGSGEICVPAGSLERLSREEIRAILAHEFAHLVRKDARWAAAVQLLDRLFFTQPLQRWAGRRYRETAEFLADDFAVGQSDSPEHLVTALTKFARAENGGMIAAGFAPGTLLVRRVERVLTGARRDMRTSQLPFAVYALAILLLVWFSPAVVPACDCLLTGLAWAIRVPFGG